MKFKSTLVLAIVLFSSGCLKHYSQGERVGVPFKFSRKGFFCKTWEGSANLGGMRSQSVTSTDGKSTSTQMVPNTWDFTILDKDEVRFNSTINDAIERGETVKFTYDQEAFPICDSDSGYFITDIKELK